MPDIVLVSGQWKVALCLIVSGAILGVLFLPISAFFKSARSKVIWMIYELIAPVFVIAVYVTVLYFAADGVFNLFYPPIFCLATFLSFCASAKAARVIKARIRRKRTFRDEKRTSD